ncbi:hypothetical protein [Deinococcus ruber]|uniref:Uncharacterized protein n=1 Tax=Deinococcus ruber TaxID=1848197 RepID=A0A918CCH1_9DEIO|nr:hypothetical protein [Deinococcus ruber]GGR15716.1 hypothetical protein GCM10008957_30570 [Deinococcus ruber]
MSRISDFLRGAPVLAETFTDDELDALVDAQTEAMFEEWSTRLLASLTLNVQRTPLDDPRIAQRCRKTTALPRQGVAPWNTAVRVGTPPLHKQPWDCPWPTSPNTRW